MPIRSYSRHKWNAYSISSEPISLTSSVGAIAARSSLGAFGEYVAGKPPQQHHLEWFPHLRTGIETECLKEYGGDPTDLLAPRGSAKSTWAAILCADCIGHNPHVQILYLSNSRAIALRQSRLVKRIIETPQYQDIFPHIRPGKRWADEDWEIDKKWAGVSNLDSDSTLKAFGILGSVIGGRFHLVLADDLIKSSKAIANPKVREDMQQSWGEVIEPTLIPGGRFLDIGTRFRRDDIHVTEFNPDNDWVTIETSAIRIDEGGNESIYWDRYKLEKMQSLRQRKPLIFTYQFQNKLPPNDEEVKIKREWIKWGIPPERFDKMVLGGDLAASESKSNDMSAFVLVGLIRKPFQLWVLGCWYARIVGNLEKLLLINFIRETEGNFELVPESNGYQRSLQGDFKTIFINTWGIRSIKVVPTPSKGDKHERLEGISGVFANGFVTFDSTAPTKSYDKVLKCGDTEARVRFNNNLSQLVAQLTFNEDGDDLSDACEKAIARLQGRNAEIWSE